MVAIFAQPKVTQRSKSSNAAINYEHYDHLDGHLVLSDYQHQSSIDIKLSG